MSLLIPPSEHFAQVLRLDAESFLQRQEAFVVLVLAATGSIPADHLPAGNFFLEDYRADEDSDGYLRLFTGTIGHVTVLVEVASLRCFDDARGRGYEVMVNDRLPEGSLNGAWELLRTGSGLECYEPPEGDQTLASLLAQMINRPVLSNMSGGRIRFR